MAKIMMMMVLFWFDIYIYSILKIFLLASRKNYVFKLKHKYNIVIKNSKKLKNLPYVNEIGMSV